MEKSGLGPVMDENGNVKYEPTKQDKINIFADTLLGIEINHSSNSPPSGLHQFINPRPTTTNRTRDHITIDMPDGWGTGTAEYSRRLAQINDTSLNRSNSRPRTNADKLRLNHVYVSANECIEQLEKVRCRLAQFASRDEQIARGQKVLYPIPDFVQLADLAQQIMTLSREAFIPAHRLCSAVIGLYMTEDFIREPIHIEFPDYFEGRIQIPSKRSNRKTLLQLQMCVDTVTEYYAKFQPTATSYDRNKYGGSGSYEIHEMRGILLMMRHIIQELYSTGSGCFDLLNILLYIDPPEQEAFIEFLNNLNSMEKSDLLEGIARLRRTVDNIPLLLEKLSWASYTVFRLASGKSALNSPIESSLDTPNDVSISNSKQSLEISKQKMEAFALRAAAQAGHHQNSGSSAAGVEVAGCSKSKSKNKKLNTIHGQKVDKNKCENRIQIESSGGAHFDEHSRPRSREKLIYQNGHSSRSKDKKHQQDVNQKLNLCKTPR